MRFLAVLTVRNEAAFLLEWLAHHQAVGFTDFLVFSNDCTDGTDKILDHLDDLGLLTHVRNDGPHTGGVQWTALKSADKHPLVKKADWILPLDVDEFVNIHVGDHTLTALTQALPDATAIPLTWRLFGCAGQVRYRDTPVTETFTKAAPDVLFWPWRASMFKTLYRNDKTYKKLGVHRPRNPDDKKLDRARWFDGSGRELDEKFKTKRIFSNFGRDNYKLVQLNHYPLGAMESYVMKAHRGRAVHGDDLLGMDYWVERNFNTVDDTSISALNVQMHANLAKLMSDKKLARLHQKAVEWRQKTFEKLMREEPFRALFGRLLMTPPTQPVPQKAAQFMRSFAGADKNSPNKG